jgi:hypothetical protein
MACCTSTEGRLDGDRQQRASPHSEAAIPGTIGLAVHIPPCLAHGEQSRLGLNPVGRGTMEHMEAQSASRSLSSPTRGRARWEAAKNAVRASASSTPACGWASLIRHMSPQFWRRRASTRSRFVADHGRAKRLCITGCWGAAAVAQASPAFYWLLSSLI